MARRRPPSRQGPRERPVLDAKAARLAAFDLLARKSWSGRELGQRLRRRGAPAEVARDVVAELTARGYVDDQAFARWWAEARARGRQIGSARLRQELLAKGIPRELATAAVTAAFEETPESERAMEAGRRRLRALLTGRRDRVAARLGDYLLRRGYPPAVARSTVRRLLAEHVGEVPPEAGDDGSGV